MKPAVSRPASASRVRCSIGRRTSACTPLMNARPVSSAYLLSHDTGSRGLRMLSGKGAFMVASPGVRTSRDEDEAFVARAGACWPVRLVAGWQRGNERIQCREKRQRCACFMLVLRGFPGNNVAVDAELENQ